MKNKVVVTSFLILLFFSCKTQEKRKINAPEISLTEYIEAEKFDIKNFEQNLKEHIKQRKKYPNGDTYRKDIKDALVLENGGCGKLKDRVYTTEIYILKDFIQISKTFDAMGNRTSIKYEYFHGYDGYEREITDWCHFRDAEIFDYKKVSNSYCKNKLTIKQVVKKSCDTLGINYEKLTDGLDSQGQRDTSYNDETTNNSWLAYFKYYKVKELWLVVLFKTEKGHFESSKDYRAVVLSDKTANIIDIFKGESWSVKFNEKYLK